MASNINTDLCDICEIRHKTKSAIKWCPECEEKLCDECYGNHSASKLLRNHEAIDIEQYKKLPKSVLGVKNFCDQHDMKFTNFCQQHDQLCCPACLAGSGLHSKCSTLLLQDVIQTAKTSVLLQSVEETLKNLKHNLRMIINDRQSNLKNLHDQREKILKEVKQMKEKIVKNLADFEKNISDELEEKIQKNNRILKSEIVSLEERFQEAETMLNESNTIKQCGSDLQIFIGSKSMETKVGKMNNNLQKLKQVDVTIKWSSKIDETIKKLSSLGSIVEERKPIAVVLTGDKGTQVQVMQPPRNIPIEDITITLKSEFKITGKRVIGIRGCSIFPNNKAIFVDNENNNIVLFKENGEKEKVIPTSSRSWDVTIIDDNTIAVSTDKGVDVINITTNAVKKINTGWCVGLEYYKGSLFCCVPGKGVLSVDLTSSTITNVVKDTVDDGWYYCTVYNDRIYTTRAMYHTVSCYTMGGDKVWENKDPSVIYFPLGIAVDNSSNVYVASCNKHSIKVLSPDGQRHRTLLTKKDGIYCPHALYFDRSKNQLLLGNEGGPGLLFSI